MGGCMQLKSQVLTLGYIGFWIWLLLFLIYGHKLEELLELILNLCKNPLNCHTPDYVILFFKIGLAILIASHASLIYGTIVKKYWMLLPWLISMACFFIIVICSIVIRWTSGVAPSYDAIWPTELIRILIVCFLLYNWHSVLLYFRQVRFNSKLRIPQQIRPMKSDDVPYVILNRY